jgi:hypothetical protein
MRWRTGWIVALLASLPGTHVAAQARVDQLPLPRSVADTVIDFFNRPSTIRFTGRVEIPAGRVVVGDVAVLGGPVIIGGQVQGDLAVVNGNLTIAEGGTVTGNVTVLGGVAHTLDTSVGGQLAVYEQELPYRQRGGQITYDVHRWDRWQGRQDLVHLSVRVAESYNRVEGLPVMFGPVFQTSAKNYTRIDALAIWRSQSGPHLASNDLGYLVRGEQHFGPGGRYSVGASAQSLVQPIESWRLTNIEASLATFLLHEDFRDYYQRKGFGAFLRYDHPGAGVHLTVEYRSEDQGFLTAVSPWTLRRNAEPWRPQPLVGEGRIGTMTGQLVLDGRNDRDDPTDGWYLQASSTFGVSGSLTMPAYLQPEPAPATVVSPARRLPNDFKTGFLDLRRYIRLGPDSDLRLRGLLAGSLDGEPLPPQYQHTLGGEGSLPGYGLMSADCGVRAQPYSILQGPADNPVRTSTFAGYGCDRIALFQAEYRGNLSFNLNLGSDHNPDGNGWSWYPDIDLSPSWAVFFDAGRGWSLAGSGAAIPPFVGTDTQTLMDVGAGVSLGDIGIYWAWPLNGGDKKVNFFLRIAHRF